MKLIWIRHGETNENKARRYLGHADVPLNAKGKFQAKRLSKQLKGLQGERIVTSDLSRCYETAKIIGKALNITPLKTKKLRELDFGAWDLKTYNEIMASHKREVQNWYDDPYYNAPPYGECLMALGKRVDEVLNSLIVEMENSSTTIIVSHGGPIRWFQSEWLEARPNQFWSVNGLKHGEGITVEFNKHEQEEWIETGRWG